MVAPMVESIREELVILHDDKKWKEVREKAEEMIFKACGDHLNSMPKKIRRLDESRRG